MRRFFRTAASDRPAPRLGLVPDRELPVPADLPGLDALRQLLAAYHADRSFGRGEQRECDRALRRVAQRLAHEARARDAVRGERLVIMLRQTWRDLPEVQALGEDGRRERLWDRLVLLCCEEFYAPGVHPPGGTAPESAA